MKVEFQGVTALEPEVIVVVMVGRQVVEDGGAVFVTEEPRQVSLQDVQADARSSQAGVKHLRSAPAASPPYGFTGIIQEPIPL